MCKKLLGSLLGGGAAPVEQVAPAPAAAPVTGNENKGQVKTAIAEDQTTGRRSGRVKIAGANQDPLSRRGVPGLGL